MTAVEKSEQELKKGITEPNGGCKTRDSRVDVERFYRGAPAGDVGLGPRAVRTVALGEDQDWVSGDGSRKARTRRQERADGGLDYLACGGGGWWREGEVFNDLLPLQEAGLGGGWSWVCFWGWRTDLHCGGVIFPPTRWTRDDGMGPGTVVVAEGDGREAKDAHVPVWENESDQEDERWFRFQKVIFVMKFDVASRRASTP